MIYDLFYSNLQLDYLFYAFLLFSILSSLIFNLTLSTLISYLLLSSFYYQASIFYGTLYSTVPSILWYDEPFGSISYWSSYS